MLSIYIRGSGKYQKHLSVYNAGFLRLKEDRRTKVQASTPQVSQVAAL